MAWTTASGIGTCPTSASCGHRSTARPRRSSHGRRCLERPLPRPDPARQPPDGGRRIPDSAGIGLEGPGIVVYGAALATLVLLDIGYMRGRWGFLLDAPWVYLGL